MAYDATKPLDDGYLADAPTELRELHRALKEDKIVNAGLLSGYSVGNGNGKIPLNNGTLNTNLNADLLDGHDSAYFSASTHTHSGATTSAAGFMTAMQVTKLDGIATGAEVNQNAFSNVTVGNSTIQADGKTDTLTLAAGTGITLTADTTNDKVTIAHSSYTAITGKPTTNLTPDFGETITVSQIKSNATGHVTEATDRTITIPSASKIYTGIVIPANSDLNDYKTAGVYYCGSNADVGTLANLPAGANVGFTLFVLPAVTTQVLVTYSGAVYKRYYRSWSPVEWLDWILVGPYTHPTSAGNKHIPSGGSSGQILRWSADGTAAWGADSNTDTKVTATKITFPSSSTNYYLLASSSDATATEGVSKFGTNARLQVQNGTTSAEGRSTIILGNSTAAGTEGNVTGCLCLYNSSTKYGELKAHAGDTTNRTAYLPKASGTLVCHTTDTAVGSATKPVYVSAAGVATACTYELNKSVPSDAVFTDTVYTHPTTAGNKHIPSGGSSGQFLKWSASGTAVWAADNNTTYSAGHGLVLSSTTFRLAVPLCTCATAAGTAAKVASVTSGTFALNAGAMAMVKMDKANTNTSGCTLNIGSTGAKTIYGANLTGYCLVYYDGSAYRVISNGAASQSKYDPSCSNDCGGDGPD